MLDILKRHQFFTILMGFFLFLIPFVHSSRLFYGANNAKVFFVYIASYISFAFFSYYLLTKKNYISFQLKPLFLLSLGVLVWGYIASFAGVSLQTSLWSDLFRSTGILFLSHLPLTALVWSEMFEPQDWVFLRRIIIVSSAIFSFLYSFGSFGFNLIQDKIGVFNFTSNGLTIGNETFAGIFVFITIILTLVEISKISPNSSPRLKWFLYSALVLQFLSPLMIGFPLYTSEITGVNSIIGDARSSSVVAWAALFYFAVIQKLFTLGYKKLISIITIVILVFISFVSVSLFVSGSFVQKKYIELSGSARIMIWESSFKSMTPDKVLFGYGPENFNDSVQKNIDNRLYLDKNGGEIWFDRAHNVIVETFVTRGVFGLLLGVALFAYIFVLIRKLYRKAVIAFSEMSLLSILFVGHIIQIMTGFDTAVSYFVWIFVLAYLLQLEKQSGYVKTIPKINSQVFTKITRYIFIGICLLSLLFIYIPERTRQVKTFNVFTGRNFSDRIVHIEEISKHRASLEQIRVLSSGLVSGIFEGDNAKNEALRNNTLIELGYYDEMLVRFIEENPHNYRARMNLVYLRFAEAFLGNNKLEETTYVFENIETLSSKDNPLTPVMFGLHSFYTNKIPEAQKLIDDAVKINTDIDFSKGVQEYLNAQIKNLPRVAFLKLENL